MPTFECTDPEPRTYPNVPTVLGEDGEPLEFAAHELVAGDVIEAAANPDPSRFVEAKPETPAQRKKREKAELEALAALTPEEQAALQSLSPTDIEALTALAG